MATTLTLVQLQAMSDALLQAIGNAVLTVRYPDGRSVEFRSMKDLLAAKAAIDDEILTYGGGSASKSTLGQTRRGDGPVGPGFPGSDWGFPS
jgi:hypothetical protein